MTPRNQGWSECLRLAQPTGLRCSTIHDAKGREFDSVLLVIPPDRGRMDRTETLLASWEVRAENEAKRVIYVGATRAQQLLAIAIPSLFWNRLQSVLEGARVSFEVHTIV